MPKYGTDHRVLWIWLEVCQRFPPLGSLRGRGRVAPHLVRRCRDRRELLPLLPWRCRLQHFGQHENAQADGLVSWSCCRCCPVFLKSIFSTAQQASPYALYLYNSKTLSWEKYGNNGNKRGYAQVDGRKCCCRNVAERCRCCRTRGCGAQKGRGKPNSPPRPCHDAARVLPFCGRLRVVPCPAGAVAVHALLANVVPARAAGVEYARYLCNGPS